MGAVRADTKQRNRRLERFQQSIATDGFQGIKLKTGDCRLVPAPCEGACGAHEFKHRDFETFFG